MLDPFMGSGTTALACLKINRHYIGIEMMEKYYHLAIKAIEKENNGNRRIGNLNQQMSPRLL